MEAELAEKGQGFGHELTRGVPLMGISRGQAQEIASRSVVKRLGLLERPLAPSREQRNLTAFFNHDDCPREEMSAVLCFEVLSRASWEGCHKGADHARQQTKELGFGAIFAIGKGLAECRLMRKRRQGVDVCEEVINQELENRHWCDRFGVQNTLSRDVHQRLGRSLR